MSSTIAIEAPDGTRARIALLGAEPVSWTVADREYVWSGDPAHWNRHAPWLFPVVGASVDGKVQVDGQLYPMAQHGFVRDADFAVVAQTKESVTMQMRDNAETLAHYPFAFNLDIISTVAPSRLDFTVTVTNTDDRPLPYGLGFHPAFPWPFVAGIADRNVGHRVVFEAAETDQVPQVGSGGVLLHETRGIPMDGQTLPLHPSLFEEALVFLDASSRTMRFEAPTGAAIVMSVDDFPHLAVWTKPTAPFLSLECWTGHADLTGFRGELTQRASQRCLAPGEKATHRVTLALDS